MRGTFCEQEATVKSVYRKRLCVYLDTILVENVRKRGGRESTHRPFQASNLMITKLELNNSRKKVIEKKAAGRQQFLTNPPTL